LRNGEAESDWEAEKQNRIGKWRSRIGWRSREAELDYEAEKQNRIMKQKSKQGIRRGMLGLGRPLPS